MEFTVFGFTLASSQFSNVTRVFLNLVLVGSNNVIRRKRFRLLLSTKQKRVSRLRKLTETCERTASISVNFGWKLNMPTFFLLITQFIEPMPLGIGLC